MAQLDYFVATLARSTAIEAVEPRILASLNEGRPIVLYGYSGMTFKKISYAVSRDGRRSLVAGTGAAAHEAAKLFFSLMDRTDDVSIARIDVQETLSIIDPDTTIVFTTPKKSYKATRIHNVNADGETLYVGSPHSRARLRLYNKTAESGVWDGDLKLLRVEVQLRDSYAETAFQKWKTGKLDEVLAFWVTKMLHEGSANDILNLCRYFQTNADFALEDQDQDWITRRKLWFERSVVPAMAKLFLVEPEYAEVASRLLTDKAGESTE